MLLLRTIPELPDQRPEVGKVGNLVRKALEGAVETRQPTWRRKNSSTASPRTNSMSPFRGGDRRWDVYIW